MLLCAFGERITDKTLTYFENGKSSQKPISSYIRDVFKRSFMRLFSPQILFFRKSGKWHLQKSDRENRENIYRLRQFFNEIVERRKIEQKLPNY